MRTIIFTTCCLCCSPCRGQTEPPKPQLTTEDLELFAWFDSLNFPTLKGRFVTAEPPYSSRDSNAGTHGFLLEDHPDRFSLLTLGLDTARYTRHPSGPFEFYQSTPVPLEEYATEHLRRLRAAKAAGRWEEWTFYPTNVRNFVLARGCAANGLPHLAHELLQHINTTESKGLRATVANEMANAQMRRHMFAFGVPSTSRRELLMRFRKFVQRFPDSPHNERAQKAVVILSQMIEEDDAHDRRPHIAIDQMTTSQRVTELIYQLREQNGEQFTSPGCCNIFRDSRDRNWLGRPRSAAAQLVAMGYDAVPQLIEHLDDNRFTLSIQYHRVHSCFNVRVDHCVVAVLQKIADRQFFYSEGCPRKWSATDSDIKVWWKHIQKQEEKQRLMKATAGGRQIALRHARQLLEKHPDVALTSIEDGIENAKSDWTRVGLVELAAKLEGDASTKLLLEQLQQGSRLAVRMAAAQGLLRRRPEHAVARAVEEWQSLSANDDAWTTPEGARLLKFLATCNRSQAILALNQNLDRQHTDQRLAVVTAFGQSHQQFSIHGGFNGDVLNHSLNELSPEDVGAIEAMLMRATIDTAEGMGFSGDWDGKRFVHPRVCDFAAHVLADRWSRKYQFDLAASLSIRDRQRAEMQNVWRAQNGEAPLPLPKLRPLIPASDEQIKPLIGALVEARTDEARSHAVDAIERLGLPALSAITTFTDSLPKDHEAYVSLEDLVQRMSCIVAAEHMDPSVPLNEAAKAQLKRLAGRPLTTDGIEKLLRAATADPPLPDNARGFVFAVDRASKGNGVELRLLNTDGDFPEENAKATLVDASKGWRVTAWVGASPMYRDSFELAPTANSRSLKYLLAQVHRTLACAPKQPVCIRIRVAQEQPRDWQHRLGRQMLERLR